MKLIVGNFGGGNLGDELILSACLERYSSPDEALVMTVNPVFSQKFCETSFKTVPFPPSGLKSLIRYIFSKNYRESLQKYSSEVSEIIFPGGGLFAIRLWACLVWSLNIWFLKKIYPHVPIKLLHQGVDQNMGTFSKKLMQWSFAQASEISVRDNSSLQALRHLGFEKVEVRSDIVLEQLQNFNFDGRQQPQKIVLLNALSEIDSELLDKIKTRFTNYKFQYLPMQGSDKKFVIPEAEMLSPKTKSELFQIFVRAEFAVGERLHFLIVGARFIDHSKLVTLKKPYSEKVADFCAKFGIESIY